MTPSPSQITSIREQSQIVFGSADHVFDHYGKPESREVASAVVKALLEIREGKPSSVLEDAYVTGYEHTQEKPIVTRTCADCGVEKPIKEFRKFGRGRRKECLACDPFEKGTPKTEKPTEDTEAQPEIEINVPEPPADPGELVREFSRTVTGEHWCLAELRDPRVSALRQIADILNKVFHEYEVGLDDAALVAAELADLDLS